MKKKTFINYENFKCNKFLTYVALYNLNEKQRDNATY